jgi:hypothetical protein
MRAFFNLQMNFDDVLSSARWLLVQLRKLAGAVIHILCTELKIIRPYLNRRQWPFPELTPMNVRKRSAKRGNNLFKPFAPPSKRLEKSACPLFGEDHEDPKQRENGCGHDCEQVLHSLAFFYRSMPGCCC